MGGSSFIDKLIVFIVGFLFAMGLMISGMSRRANILHFLQINDYWNPALLFVLGCGLLVNFITFAIMRSRGRSLNGNPVFDSKGATIDWKLVLGAFCFGIGWGIAGLCPGPGMASLVIEPVSAALFVGAMLVGMTIARLFEAKA